MSLLLEYLDSNGWETTRAGTLRIEKDGWIYDWEGTGRLTNLWRWPINRSSDHEIDIFIITDETRGLEVAQGIMSGNHPDSPIRDPKSYKKIGTL